MPIPRTQRGGWPYSQPPNVPFIVNQASPQAKGLVFWIPMLGSQGTTGPVRDLADGRFPMTQFNTPAWINDGERGWTLLFNDAASEYLRHATAAPVTAAPLTISCWFNTDEAGTWQTLACLIDNTDFLHNWFTLYVDDGIVRWRARGAVAPQAITSTSYSINTWHHACGIEAASNDRRVYLDGGSKGTENTNVVPANIDSIGIGANVEQPNPVHFFSGRLIDIRIYNRALSDAEVWQQYVNPWELYHPLARRLFVRSPVAPPVGQPMMLRGTTVPHIGRQWHPRVA